MTLTIVTATTNPTRAKTCMESWGVNAAAYARLYVVVNGCHFAPPQNVALGTVTWLPVRAYLGTVPAFALGVQAALDDGAEIIACFHDDLEIDDPDWAATVLTHFESHPQCGLAGFGGALGLGSDDLYQTPYNPMQLARQTFMSNMRDAEAHGLRVTTSQRVACLDGFSQIGRRAYWEGYAPPVHIGIPVWDNSGPGEWLGQPRPRENLFTQMQTLGMRHHWYDGALGCYATRLGWETWYLPIRCHHFGGRTAVGDAGYAAWAQQQVEGGDAGFWKAAHEIGYDHFRDVLPLRTKEV